MGLPWIQVRTNIRTHPKSMRLGIRLKDPRAYRLVVDLFLWCGEAAPDGRIKGPDADLVLEAGAGWDGEPGRFAAAALEVGFVDRDGDDLVVHDWADHNGAHAAKVERDRKKAAERREEERAARRSKDHTSTVARPSRDGRATVEGERERRGEVDPLASQEGGGRQRHAAVASGPTQRVPDAPAAPLATPGATSDASPTLAQEPAETAPQKPAQETKQRQLGLAGIHDGAEAVAGAKVAPAPVQAAKARREPKLSAWQTLREDLRQRRDRALPDALPDVELAGGPAALNARLSAIAAEATARHAVALVDAYEAFLCDEHARSRDPACPFPLFVARWPKYASAARRAKGNRPQQPGSASSPGTNCASCGCTSDLMRGPLHGDTACYACARDFGADYAREHPEGDDFAHMQAEAADAWHAWLQRRRSA